ncbi:MAG: phosphoribosylanthranilate isomerase [Nitrososphaerota archaeon]|jgi:phosphoribosylanthranilate isomerase|nr:phosphoribosylanthranilate isomerase [Nitrososphaerota archaeon]MDG6943187.1 phosphoribosylanthranilate isomerase [Nitrososphaerota archaeon]MDG6950935.1 phosphoribosylanthranilate isomerase [Nitrososphaerota archaeon]
MIRVKICGLTREEDVDLAVEAGADAVGFVSGFPESPRSISVERAGELIRRVPPFVDSVLVARAELVESNMERIARIGPSAIQLYGRTLDPVALKEKLGVKLILPQAMGGRRIGAGVAAGYDAMLADTYAEGAAGGTGRTSDWEECRRLRDLISPLPFILSGGLQPDNVVEAISRVRPYAVDVSSGVESSPGVKDPSKVIAFVAGAKGKQVG